MNELNPWLTKTGGPNTMISTLMRTVIFLLLAMALCLIGIAQTGVSDVQSPAQLFLHSHPEVVDQLKALLARQLQDEGSAIDQQAISDAMLSARLESDAKFRAAAVRLLVEQGSITEEQARSLTTQLGPPREEDLQETARTGERPTSRPERTSVSGAAATVKAPAG
jgi:hypothetical protein